MQCFGGLFRPRATQSNVSSTSDAPKTALNASEESSAATCSAAACAQQQSTETCQQYPNSIPAQLPPAPQSVAPSAVCNGSAVANQQAPHADAVSAPAAVTTIVASSRNEVAAAPKIPAHVPFISGPEQPPVLAGPVLSSVPARTAAQMARGGQNSSRCAMEAFSIMSCSTGPSATSFACLGQGNRMTQQEPKKLGGLHPGQLQLQRSSLLPTQASLERRDSCPGLLATEVSFSWDYIQPKVSSKDVVGQRKKDVRGSLDLDFANEVPMAVTRRSKEYGEQRPYMGKVFGAGRSYSGSISDNGMM